MTARIDASGRRSAPAVRQVLPAVLTVTLLGWIAIVTARGALLALQTFGIPVVGAALQNFATPRMLWAAALVYLACLLASLIARRFRPAATIPITYATGGAIVLAGAISTSMVGALIVIIAMLALSWLLGASLLRHLPATADLPLVRAPIAIGLGCGLVGLLLLLLTTLDALNAVTVLAGAAVILVFTVVVDRDRLTHGVFRLRNWRPITPTWFETVITGLTVGLVAFALLSSFVPENQSDAIRQHLPVAREIWQTGSAPALPSIGASTGPVQSHLLFAVAYGFGGMTAAKLVHTVVGLAAIAGVAAIGWLCSGRIAATVGAVIFATMPIVLWELGHAYLDLFPVLFTVAAVLCLLLWQQDGAAAWLVYAGGLAGFGFATKIVMAVMIVALAGAIFLVGRVPGHWRKRVLAVLVFGVGVIVIVPWLMRTYSITGTVPGITILSNQIGGLLQVQVSETLPPVDTPIATVPAATVPADTTIATVPTPTVEVESGVATTAAPVGAADSGAAVDTAAATDTEAAAQTDAPADPGAAAIPTPTVPAGPVTISSAASDTPVSTVGRAAFDFSRSPLDLVRTPWQMTFQGEVYHSQGAGDVGIALLTLLPLAIFGPRTRAVAFLAVTAGASYVGWWLTPQITRHLLPTLAIAAALAGIGVASVLAVRTYPAPLATPARRIVARVAQLGVVVGLVAAPLLYLPNWKTELPVDLFLGRETAAEYVARAIPSAAILAATSDDLPPDTNIGYIGVWEGPQIYTEARLTYWSAESFGTGTPEVLGSLEDLGIDYWVWNRAESSLVDWRSAFLSTEFLRKHARILAGDRDTYLFEIVPGKGLTWGAAHLTNLLEDPDLTTVGDDDGPWTSVAKAKAKGGVVSILPKSSISQLVPVSGGSPYLLVASGTCQAPADTAVLSFHWFDEGGAALGTASESVIPGIEQSDQFLWRQAPEGATSVSVELAASKGLGARCEFDQVRLYNPP